MALLALSAALAALALFIYKARPRDPVNLWFALFTAFVALWAFAIAGLQGGAHLDLWGRLTFASATLIPPTFFAFIYYYPVISAWPSRLVLNVVLFAGVILAFLTLVTSLLVREVTLTAVGLSRTTGILYPFFSVYFAGTWLVAMATFVGKWRRARSLARAQLQYLGTAIILSVGGGTTVNFMLPLLTGRSTYSWIGPYFGLVLTLMVGHAIIRHRLMDVRLVIHRGLAYLSCIAAFVIVVLALTRLVNNSWSASPLLIHSDVFLVLIISLIMISTPVYRLFMRFIDPYLYRRKIDYPVALRLATHQLSHLMEPQELSLQLHNILMTTVVPESFSMIARADDSGQIEELLGDLHSSDLGLSTPPAPVALLLEKLPKPSVFLLNPGTEIAGTREATQRLRGVGIEAVIVLGRRGELLGAVFLGARKSGDAYFAADIGFLESLADLASISLENALLYRQRIAMLEYSDRLLESLDSAVIAVDAAGRITSLNPATTALLGLSGDLRGHSLELLPTDIGWALALAVRGEWRPRELEATVSHPVRGNVPVILSTAILHGTAANISGALVVVTDLSAVKALERNQRRIEHLSTMARFYAGLTHEIRSPLTSISNFVAMLADRFDDAEFRDTAMRLLPAEVARIVQLAERLRLMAPSESGTLTPVSLQTLLADIIAIHAPAAKDLGIKLLLVSSSDIPMVMGDAGQLVQLFVNLVNNAIESMTKAGTISIETASSTRSTQPTVIVHITDEGSGVDPTVRGKIFEPFFTTKHSGTGLGLAICQEIAAFHHARLYVMPRVDTHGTLVSVEFPAAPDALTRDPLTLKSSRLSLSEPVEPRVTT